jgi:hypothetical protein
MASEHGREQWKVLAFAGDQIGIAFLAQDTFTKNEDLHWAHSSVFQMVPASFEIYDR